MNLSCACFAVLQRELRLALRRRAALINPLLFYIMVISLFPLAISPEPAQLRILAPGILWVAALLATLLSLEGLFRADYDDGSLEQLLLSAQPLPVLIFAKMLGHWVVTGLPLLLLTPLSAILLHVPARSIAILLASLALGLPVLQLMGAIAAALMVSVRSNSLLLPLLVLPFYIPVLIFGTSAVMAANAGLAFNGQLAFLGALLLLALSVGPWTIAAALRACL